MKTLIAVLLLAASTGASTAAPKKPAPAPVQVGPTKEEISKDWLDGARKRIADLQQEQERAQNQADEAIKANQMVESQLAILEQQVIGITKERDDWVAYGNDQHDKYMGAEKRIEQEKTNTANERVKKMKAYMMIGLMTIGIATYAIAKFYFRFPI